MNTSEKILTLLCVITLPLSPASVVGSEAVPTYFTLGTHQAFILQPSNAAADSRVTPWVWYAPTRVGSTPNPSNQWLFQQLLDNGIAVAGIDVGESYGNPAGRATYSDFYDYATSHANLAAKPLLLGQSRGALMLLNWAAENAQKVGGIAGIYPVCDLRCFPGLETAAQAYGMTPQQLAQQLADNNPIDRLTPLAQAGVPLFSISGDSDPIAPLAQNSQVVYDRYHALGGSMELVIIPGKGHEEIPEYFQSPKLLDFLVTNASVVPEPRMGLLLGSALFGVAAYTWWRCRDIRQVAAPSVKQVANWFSRQIGNPTHDSVE